MSEQVVENTEAVTPEQTEQEASLALSAGYNKVRGETPTTVEEPAKVKTPEGEAKEQKQDESEPKEEVARAADPWEGVPTVVRQALEKLPEQLRNINGHIGGLTNAVKVVKENLEAGKQAAQAAAKSGAEAPTQAQINAAVSSGEKWKAIKDDFPEWAEAMEERLAAYAATKPQEPAADVEKLRREWQEGTKVQVAGAIEAAEERAYVRIKHPNWKRVINTDGFLDWSVAGGPSREEYLKAKDLSETAPQEAAQMKAGFRDRFPQWYEDKGALIYSASADDAVKLLDNYAEHQKAAAAKAAVEAKNKQRLAAAVAPKQAASGGPTILPDEAGLRVGYERIAKKRFA